MQMQGDVVVTGIGFVLPGCDGRSAFWKQLVEGDSQLSIERMQDGRSYLLGRSGYLVAAEFEPEIRSRFFDCYPREIQLYLASLIRAVRHSEIERSELNRERVGLYDGTSRGSFAYWAELAREGGASGSGSSDLMFGIPGQAVSIGATTLGVNGPVYTFSNSCCSGAVAIGHAYREVASGRIEVGLASGHDACMVSSFLASYEKAGLMCLGGSDPKHAYRVFLESSGVIFAEGAVTVVLERRSRARQRGAQILGSICGYDYGNHGLHPTNVDTSGERPARLIRDLLRDADASTTDVGFVVGHGNGAPESDRSELAYMRAVFGSECSEVPLISVKPIYGHSLGAASATSFAASILAANADRVPPTANLHQPSSSEFHFGGGAIPRRNWRYALSMSLGIGGHHEALLIERG